MARTRDKRKRQKALLTGLPFGKKNYTIFGVALVIITIGYIALAQGPAESFMSLSVAPILLVFGYCFLIPVALFYREKDDDSSK